MPAHGFSNGRNVHADLLNGRVRRDQRFRARRELRRVCVERLMRVFDVSAELIISSCKTGAS